jgi:hypothetical protein
MNQIIPIDRLKTLVPAAFASAPHSKLSDRYQFIPTIEVIHVIADLDYFPVWARQVRAKEGNRDTTKHLIRFRHSDHVEISHANRDMQFPEIVMTNSHNGLSTYNLMSGIFRCVCENGMITMDEDCGSVKLRHMSREEDFFKQVKEVSARVVENADLGLKQLNEWKDIPLSTSEILGYAEGVKKLLDIPTVETASLVRPRRYEDRKDSSLYTTFQVVQENIIKGGAQSKTEKGQFRKTSAIKSIDKDVKMNQALWEFTSRCAQAKA